MATDPKSEALLDYLESFNRKERLFVVGDALGNPTFRLGDDFRKRLKTTFSIEKACLGAQKGAPKVGLVFSFETA